MQQAAVQLDLSCWGMTQQAIHLQVIIHNLSVVDTVHGAVYLQQT